MRLYELLTRQASSSASLGAGSWIGIAAALLGRLRRFRCRARCAHRLPGKGGTAEGVAEVIAVNLATTLIEPERVERRAVEGELGDTVVRAVDRAQYPVHLARGARPRPWLNRHGEPEAQAAARAKDLPVRLLPRQVDRPA